MVHRVPQEVPLSEWSDGWLAMEVASLLDEPLYLVTHYDEKLDRKWPATRQEMIVYIEDRRRA